MRDGASEWQDLPGRGGSSPGGPTFTHDSTEDQLRGDQPWGRAMQHTQAPEHWHQRAAVGCRQLPSLPSAHTAFSRVSVTASVQFPKRTGRASGTAPKPHAFLEKCQLSNYFTAACNALSLRLSWLSHSKKAPSPPESERPSQPGTHWHSTGQAIWERGS